MTDKAMAKRKGTHNDLQSATTLHRKLEIEQQEPKIQIQILFACHDIIYDILHINILWFVDIL